MGPPYLDQYASLKKLTVAGHTFYPELLDPNGWGLDIGCRGYEFVDAIQQIVRVGFIAVDPGKMALRKDTPQVKSVAAAVVGQWRKSVELVEYPQNSLGKSCVLRRGVRIHPAWGIPDRHRVRGITVVGLMRQFGIRHFTVVKIDCEGSEYEILQQWPGAVADQITIEFHDRWRRGPYPETPERFHQETVRGYLGQWYDAVRYRKTGPIWAQEYWDVLLVRKGVVGKTPVREGISASQAGAVG